MRRRSRPRLSLRRAAVSSFAYSCRSTDPGRATHPLAGHTGRKRSPSTAHASSLPSSSQACHVRTAPRHLPCCWRRRRHRRRSGRTRARPLGRARPGPRRLSRSRNVDFWGVIAKRDPRKNRHLRAQISSRTRKKDTFQPRESTFGLSISRSR